MYYCITFLDPPGHVHTPSALVSNQLWSPNRELLQPALGRVGEMQPPNGPRAWQEFIGPSQSPVGLEYLFFVVGGSLPVLAVLRMSNKPPDKVGGSPTNSEL